MDTYRKAGKLLTLSAVPDHSGTSTNTINYAKQDAMASAPYYTEQCGMSKQKKGTKRNNCIYQSDRN